ncbi:MAG: glycine cleavage system protein GcvH [Promethearchaeati archaeon]
MEYQIPDKLKYSPSHEWILRQNDEAIIGITDYAQDQLGDIVYIEFPEIGDKFNKGDSIAEIESIKAVEEVIIPVSGEIIKINKEINDKPENANQDPYGEGWLVRINILDVGEFENLLSAEDYIELIEKLTSD